MSRSTSPHQLKIASAFARCLDPALPYVLYGFPNYSNVGDSAIWQGSVKALREHFGRGPLHISEDLPASAPLPTLSLNTQIVLQGGGNFGDLWGGFLDFRERIVENFPDNRIVQLPQSIFFGDAGREERCRQILSRHSDLTLMVRDKRSFKVAATLHRGRTELVPDMALALGSMPRPTNSSVPIIALLRGDKERLISDDPEIRSKISVTDWIHEPRYRQSQILKLVRRMERYSPATWGILNKVRTVVSGQLARLRIERGCRVLSQGRVVITDRLHGHILCALMKIPHVVMDNSYGKNRQFAEAWKTCEDAECLEAPSLSEAYVKALGLLSQIEGRQSDCHD